MCLYRSLFTCVTDINLSKRNIDSSTEISPESTGRINSSAS